MFSLQIPPSWRRIPSFQPEFLSRMRPNCLRASNCALMCDGEKLLNPVLHCWTLFPSLRCITESRRHSIFPACTAVLLQYQGGWKMKGVGTRKSGKVTKVIQTLYDVKPCRQPNCPTEGVRILWVHYRISGYEPPLSQYEASMWS